MQIKSSCESMCVDFYEIKDINGKIDTQMTVNVTLEGGGVPLLLHPVRKQN